MTLGQILRGVREERGWTLAEVEERSGVTRGFLALIEAGRHHPKATTLITLARLFGLIPAELLFRSLQDSYRTQVGEYLGDEGLALLATGYTVELRRPDGSLLSWQALGTGAIGVDLRPDEEALGADEALDADEA